MCAQENKYKHLIVCNGRIHDCQEINNDDIEINYSNDPIRRIQNIKYSDGETHGIECSESCVATNKVRSNCFFIF